MGIFIGGSVVEEIAGLIRLYKNGHVERLPAVPQVSTAYAPEPTVATRDVIICHSSVLWARVYAPRKPNPNNPPHRLLPVLLYFHGGGFCVGSPAWRCYHEFLSRLAAAVGCVVVSSSYRLAPEHRLPAAYEDGEAALTWLLGQQSGRAGPDREGFNWRSMCDFGRIFVAGDSAGAAIAYAVGGRDCVRGLILLQPFFGGETRTESELAGSPSKSVLSLAVSDCYWRMALPMECDRNHPWCNPMGPTAKEVTTRVPAAILVCVAELDILKDRNVEFCGSLRRAGKNVRLVTYEGVGHAFQILHNYHSSDVRTADMLSDIKAFVNAALPTN
ncbi:hypothetical protein HPP92_009235 [Vanilla planifolia]|uniref:Alpha/beta hydrolase fold-3 domain-containing protein n=1 Tax=Vanilla planifolia TaxID=51239 RepID=A0A835RFG9_VANPL|nr:hypothetical protein HPP92_009235 [Vanilla planifolia]